MEFAKAKEIVSTLANGVNPVTGTPFPPDSPYNHPDIIRSLFAVIEGLSKSVKPKKTIQERQQENLNNNRPRNAGLPWDDVSRKTVAGKFKAGTSVDNLAMELERTKGAIIAELKRQGIITEEQAAGL